MTMPIQCLCYGIPKKDEERPIMDLELMDIFFEYEKLYHRATKLMNKEKNMDEQIKKVRADIKHDNKKKALKDTSKLLKMDKKFDAKLEKAHLIKKKK